MRVLLDSRVLIWWDSGVRLRAEAVGAIRDADQVFVSAVSGWEVAIKAALGRLRLTRTVAEAAEESGFEELPLRLTHGDVLADLPMHHRDPFDRMLIAQAIAEKLTVLTRDSWFTKYRVKVVKVVKA